LIGRLLKPYLTCTTYWSKIYKEEEHAISAGFLSRCHHAVGLPPSCFSSRSPSDRMDLQSSFVRAFLFHYVGSAGESSIVSDIAHSKREDSESSVADRSKMIGPWTVSVSRRCSRGFLRWVEHRTEHTTHNTKSALRRSTLHFHSLSTITLRALKAEPEIK
jgi:hypothetical protein